MAQIEDYPRLLDRIKAVSIDSLVLLVFMTLTAYIFSLFGEVSDQTRIVAFVLIFIAYDPICTSSFGGTVGHLMMGIRVKRAGNLQKNLLFPFALIRFIAKAFLGWVSLLTVMANDKRQAIHDAVVSSIVIYKDDL